MEGMESKDGEIRPWLVVSLRSVGTLEKLVSRRRSYDGPARWDATRGTRIRVKWSPQRTVHLIWSSGKDSTERCQGSFLIIIMIIGLICSRLAVDHLLHRHAMGPSTSTRNSDEKSGNRLSAKRKPNRATPARLPRFPPRLHLPLLHSAPLDPQYPTSRLLQRPSTSPTVQNPHSTP